MAATGSAWAKPGARALDSEVNDAELLQQCKQASLDGPHLSNSDAAATNNNSAPTADFPSLATAAATKPKKKKGQALSLQEFATLGTIPKPSSQASKGLTTDELLALPTGPRQRSAEELDRNKLGGGFKSYGNNYDRPARGSSDEQPRRQKDSSRDFAPSEADEIDDWGAVKKSTAGNGNGFERRERGGILSDWQSRADEVDNWASNKTFVPSEGLRNDRRGGSESTGGADSANWLKRKEEEERKFGSSVGGAFDSLRERRGGGFDSAKSAGANSDSWGRKKEEATTTSGRPRLNLRPRTVPVGGQNEGIEKAKGSSPFGDARPREEVLKEKGQDWIEMDEKLESSKIREATAVMEEKPGSGKNGFGSGRGSLQQQDRNDSTWRKPEPQPEDASPLRSVLFS